MPYMKTISILVGLAVMVHQPNPDTKSFGDLPFFYLAQLSGRYWRSANDCELCKAGIPAESVYVPA